MLSSSASGSGGATGGPTGHWPTYLSVWLTQFIGPKKCLVNKLSEPNFFVFGQPIFERS